MMTHRLIVAALLACLTTWASASVVASADPAAPTTRPSPPPGNKAVIVSLDGEVNDYTRDVIVRGFNQARDLRADVVILRINTYGGLVTSGLDISRFLKNQTIARTIAFVDSKAISAGAMIALACDE